MILAGDIGGTNTRLAVYETNGKTLNPVAMETFPSREYVSLESIVKKFIGFHNLQVRNACFGVAGPVKEGSAKVTNLEWIIDERRLKNELGLKTVSLINDLEANAHGIGELKPENIYVLNEGDPDKTGSAALVSAGTGLGEAGLFRENDKFKPFPSEGGHVEFAPRNKLETELLFYLWKQYNHVSYERLLSGQGLYNIYKFLRHTEYDREPAWLKEQLNKENPPAVISNAALNKSSKLCVSALDIFISIYGAEAGNVALKFMATGGLYLGGGITPKIIEKLKGPVFMKSFVDKGRMQTLLKTMPVYVILNDKTALIGAANFAKHTIYAL